MAQHAGGPSERGNTQTAAMGPERLQIMPSPPLHTHTHRSSSNYKPPDTKLCPSRVSKISIEQYLMQSHFDLTLKPRD